MRQTPIERALVYPKMSDGMSTTAMAAIYGSAAMLAFFAFQWKPWAAIFPFIVGGVVHAFLKVQYKKDLFIMQIYKIYNQTGDHYQPWSREELRGRGSRPRGFGRGLRC
ncbi:hypothetical protein [Burkholderia sp. Ac-20365]|uniref:hypothetical protein n=1 Tax=Burkholderia sp. Ac-20365 TaxID=2703897 RepID=UPI00197B1E9A|nr:hypothetical protein [Burkholderia sp. Ac-20365]MBN3761056.1 hypothetical protein [Burkholderia sp. Ac-20365]